MATTTGVRTGDVTHIASDALITAINSGGMWFGGIDGAIQRVAGNAFHDQAHRAALADGTAVYAPRPEGVMTSYKSVIFVVDDLKRPLREILTAGLEEADRQTCKYVTLPMLRTGVMAGVFEKSLEEVLTEFATALKSFQQSEPTHVQHVEVVVYNQPNEMEALRKLL